MVLVPVLATLARVGLPQCRSFDPRFERIRGIEGGAVYAIAFFDDGGGPDLYVGGDFESVGGVDTRHVARWDGASWSSLGGTNIPWGSVYDMTVWDDGTGPALYLACNSNGFILKWNASGWSSLGTGLSGPIGAAGFATCLAVHDDGSGDALYVGGRFSIAGGTSVNSIAKWDGSTWSDLGGGMTGVFGQAGDVNALVSHDDGTGPRLYAAGSFVAAGSTQASNLARWDGQAWSSVGAGLGSTVNALARFDSGAGPRLVAAGAFASTGSVSANRIASWDGSSWSPLGTGTNDEILAMTAFDPGGIPTLVVTGHFTDAGGVPASRIARWDGSAWSAMGDGLDLWGVDLFAHDDGVASTLYAGGVFSEAGGIVAAVLAAWNGSAWSTVGPANGGGVDESVLALASWDPGSGRRIVAGGEFARPGGLLCPGLAEWDGTRWHRLADWWSAPVHALLEYDDGQTRSLIVGGNFDRAGAIPARNVARWDGTSWSALAFGVGGYLERVDALAGVDTALGARLYAGGQFHITGSSGGAGNIAVWNGSTWSAVGSGVVGPVKALAAWDDGTGEALYVGGNLTTAGGLAVNHVAKWDGASWHALGTGTDDVVLALLPFDDGSGSALYAAGNFTVAGGQPAQRVARWDGASWSPVGNGLSSTVRALAVHDDGDGPALCAGGDFVASGAAVTSHLARWSGTSWEPLGMGTDGPVRALANLPGSSGGGDLWIGGDFAEAANVDSVHVAVWRGCEDPVDRFCFGDGTFAACPCSNTGLHGRGCDNSQGTGGSRLYTSGSTVPDTLVLHAVAELPTALTIFLQGDATVAGAVAFGDGIRCVGGHLKRLYTRNASAGSAIAPAAGDPSITARSAALGDPISSGAVRWYMAYYRDANAAFCPTPSGGTFNAGNGVRVRW